MRRVLIGLTLMLAGCGSEDHFAAGTWQLEGWMESSLGSTRGHPGATLTDTVKLSEQDARMPPASVFFSRFYHGVRDGNVRFENGRVEGSYEQGRVDDIAGHTVQISGTYSRDQFRVTFDFPVFGITATQVVEGKLVEAAG